MDEIRDPGPKGVRQDWEERQKTHGNSPRSVLMKGLHPLLNACIDAWHRDVVRAVFDHGALPATGARVLDVGCGFGRLAGEITRAGHVPVGLDFTPSFCAGFLRNHGPAVCADQSHLPFVDDAFHGAYSVTSLMYLDSQGVERTIGEIDRCLADAGIILLLEPCREFNALVRSLFPRKRSEVLTMPGFSLEEFLQLAPPHWEPFAAGHCRWLTAMLPVLALATRWPWMFHCLAPMARRMDRPRLNGRRAHGRLSLYRWIACRRSQ